MQHSKNQEQSRGDEKEAQGLQEIEGLPWSPRRQDGKGQNAEKSIHRRHIPKEPSALPHELSRSNPRTPMLHGTLTVLSCQLE